MFAKVAPAVFVVKSKALVRLLSELFVVPTIGPVPAAVALSNRTVAPAPRVIPPAQPELSPLKTVMLRFVFPSSANIKIAWPGD